DHSKVVPLLPIPNRTVKRLRADDSGCTSVKVGHRQAFIAQNPAASRLAGFCFWGDAQAPASAAPRRVPVPAWELTSAAGCACPHGDRRTAVGPERLTAKTVSVPARGPARRHATTESALVSARRVPSLRRDRAGGCPCASSLRPRMAMAAHGVSVPCGGRHPWEPALLR